MSSIPYWIWISFWWVVEVFWFGFVFYGAPLTLLACHLAKNQRYRTWLGKKKGYANILSRLPGVNLRGYRNIRRATLFYLGGVTVASLFFFFQQYNIFELNLRYELLRGFIGLIIVYGVLVENWKIRLPSWLFKPAYTVDYLKKMDDKEFEHLVGRVFRTRGYSSTVTGGSGDGGVDVLVLRGETKIIVSCKRYAEVVPPMFVRDLYGTMLHEGATEGFLVTSGRFGPGTHEFIQGKPITLIDGDALCKILN